MQNVKEKNYRNEAGDELHNACDIPLEIDVIEDEDVELKTTISLIWFLIHEQHSNVARMCYIEIHNIWQSLG